jgi:transposase-like protein
LYRAVDRASATLDFLPTAKRDHKAAPRFLRKLIGRHDVPERIRIEKNGANTAAIVSINPVLFSGPNSVQKKLATEPSKTPQKAY